MDTIADLYYIMEYASYIRRQLQAGIKPNMAIVNRMAELTEKVRNVLDDDFANWVEENNGVSARSSPDW